MQNTFLDISSWRNVDSESTIKRAERALYAVEEGGGPIRQQRLSGVTDDINIYNRQVYLRGEESWTHCTREDCGCLWELPQYQAVPQPWYGPGQNQAPTAVTPLIYPLSPPYTCFYAEIFTPSEQVGSGRVW
jgi:hypothetical protein